MMLRISSRRRCAERREIKLSLVPNNETHFLLVSFASHMIKYSTEIMLGDLLEIRFVLNVTEVA
jgi:hypothetical protein